jgi:S-DNA-T family DNA segregation ATPase FtsK/SpoIIIE
VILDSPGAERLMGRGDMLYQASDAPKPQRIQGVYLADSNIEQVVAHWRQQAAGPAFDPDWVNLPVTTADGGGAEPDDLLEEAAALVRQHGTASASMLQRRLRIGYNRAARLIETLEQQGIIGPAGGKLRTVLDAGPASSSGPLPTVGSTKSDEELPL